MQETQFQSLGLKNLLDKAMTTHSSDPGGLQSKGSQRFGHDWTAKLQPSQQTNDYLVGFFFFNMVTQAISFQLFG